MPSDGLGRILWDIASTQILAELGDANVIGELLDRNHLVLDARIGIGFAKFEADGGCLDFASFLRCDSHETETESLSLARAALSPVSQHRWHHGSSDLRPTCF